MPFDLSRMERLGWPSSASVLPRRGEVRFECLTEEWRIAAAIRLESGLADRLNEREPVPINDVLWGPVDGSLPLRPAPMLRAVDPYDLVIAMAGDGCPPVITESERQAYLNTRISYNVELDATPFRMTGTLHILPGREPGSLLERGANLFFVLTLPTIHLGETHLRNAPTDAVLVNRSYVRDVWQARSAAAGAVRRPGERPVVTAATTGGSAPAGAAPRDVEPASRRRPKRARSSGSTQDASEREAR